MTIREYWSQDKNIILGDFQCEEFWRSPDELRIPHVDFCNTHTIIENMDELLIFLADPKDIVILRNMPDPSFLSYLESLDIHIPQILTVGQQERTGPISQLVTQDTVLTQFLLDIGNAHIEKGQRLFLRPYGVTGYDERLAQQINAVLDNSNQLAAFLNSKFSLRDLLNKTGVPMPEGCLCQGSKDIIRVGCNYLKKHKRIVLKELHNAGGAGLIIIDSEIKLWKLLDMWEPVNQKKILVEQWHDVKTSYNIQFYICGSSAVFYSFSRQILDNGKIRGSCFDNKDNREYKVLLHKHIEAIKPLLQPILDSGYSGIVGFDSIIDNNGKFFPAIDLNCRINLSTIFYEISSRYFDSKVSRFFSMEIRGCKKIEFSQLFAVLGSLNYNQNKKEGVVILNFTALNINKSKPGYNCGRVFFGVFSDSPTKVSEICVKVEKRFRKG